MKQSINRANSAAWILVSLTLIPSAVLGAVRGQVGTYEVELTTRPAVIPSNGPAKLVLKITDRAGKPAAGLDVRSIARMPGMPMGEREQPALEQPGQPGLYVAPANFPMGGAYEIGLKISGPEGVAEGAIKVNTGMDTSPAGGGLALGTILLGAGIALLVGFALYRMYKTNQRVNWRGLTNRSTVTGLLMIAAMAAAAVYAVNNMRRQGAMTPIEAQAMEMNTPAPPGTHTVELASVTRGTVESAVQYTGQAVAFTEVDVQPRVQGWITNMAVYQGDRVTRGQLLARLDTSQIAPQVAEREAMVTERERGVDVARSEYRQALQEADQAHSEVNIRQAALEEARANLDAARREKEDAEAELSAARSMVTDAESMVDAMKADQKYWREELARTRQLLDKGAVSKDEFQKTQSQAETADAKVRQAQAGVSRAESEVRSAQAKVRKSSAMITAAQKKVAQMQAELNVHFAHVRSSRAASEAARKRIAQAEAGVDQARAGVRAVTTTRGYSDIRSPVDGVVTQRIISPGTLVNPGQAILRVAQIEPIRLQANVPTADLERIEVGTQVQIGEKDAARPPVIARVTSVMPAVDASARTGIVEAVVANRDLRFRPGQYISMAISTGRSARSLRIPNRAVMWRSVSSGGEEATESTPYVWIAESAGQGVLTARQLEIKTGMRGREFTEVASGLEEGQSVIVSGAESLRNGETVAAVNPPAQAPAKPSSGATAVQEASVEVSSEGFKPASLELKPGVPARITFKRISEDNCGTEVLIPEYGINKPLPLNQPIVVELTPRAGEFKFTCGMDMLTGRLVVK